MFQIESDNINSQADIQAHFGNKCGYDKKIVHYYIEPPHHKRRPPALSQAKANSKDAYLNPGKYPELCIPYHLDKRNKSNAARFRRSESRSVLFNHVLPAMIQHSSLQAMKMGLIDHNGKFRPFSIDQLVGFVQKSAKEQELFERLTERRIRRSLSVLQKNGYVTLNEQKKLSDAGRFFSKDSILEINPDLFKHLNISEKDIIGAKKQELSPFQNSIRHKKSVWYKKENRFKTKEQKQLAKKEIKNAKELIAKKQSGKTLTDEEINYLAKEFPGYERRLQAEKPTAYRDYTGISKNREEVIKKNSEVNHVGQTYLAQIMARLKPKPS